MLITIPKKELKTAVREALVQELMKFRALLLPSISQKEQNDIEKLYSSPIRKIDKSIKIKI